MHVVIATGLYPPEIGGPATFTVLLEEGLHTNNIPFTTIPFSSVRRFPKGARHLVYFWKVLVATRSDSIVLALDPVSVGLPALIAAQLRGALFYLRAGGDYAWEQAVSRWGFKGLPEEFPGNISLPIAGRFLMWTEKYVARRAERVLTQSGHLASIVARWGISREKIAIIPNAVELPPLPSREEVRRKYGFNDVPIIVSAGRFVPWKGFKILIQAFSTLRKEFPKARLMLAGDGPERPLLEASASEGATFMGTLSKESLYQLLRAADVFALNTRYEGFSHQILEAFTVGVPVITTDIPGNVDLAENGKTALTVPWNDEGEIVKAIRSLLSDRELAQKIAAGGHARAKEFTPERTFAETCAALGISLS